MLIRRATASVQFRTQVFLVYVQYISAKIYSKCASQPKIAKKITQKIFLGFKVVQGHRCWYHRKALVNSACYDTQQVCVYLQPFSSYEPIVVKNGGYPSLMPSFEGNLLTQWHKITS